MSGTSIVLSSIVAAVASSSSYSATFSSSSSSSNHSIKPLLQIQISPQSLIISIPSISLRNAKGFVSNSFFVVENAKCSAISRRGLEISAKAADAAKTIEVEVDKLLGLTLGQKSGGGVVITE